MTQTNVADAESVADAGILAACRQLAGPEQADVVVTFAAAALRRMPEDQLAAADVEGSAAVLVDAFGFLTARGDREAVVRVLSPGTSILGHPMGGTVVQVTTGDRPFLLSTVTQEMALRDLQIVRSVHPILGVERDEHGAVTTITPARDAKHRESFIQLELEQLLDDEQAVDVEATLQRLFADVVLATDDFDAMRGRLHRAIAELERMPSTEQYRRSEIDEAMALLLWFLDDNFLLLGMREYTLTDVDGEPAIQVVDGAGLGILRTGSRSQFARPVPISSVPSDLADRIQGGDVVTVSLTNRLSTVRQRERMDDVSIKRIDADGNLVGTLRLLGLFTRKGLAEPSRATPVLRRRLQEILRLEDIPRASHDERMITTLFQALPKGELFQASIDELRQTLVGLLHAEERRETRVMVRADRHTRTVSVLVSVPRDRYSPQLRRDLTELFTATFGASRVDVDLSLGDRADAIARFLLEVDGDIPTIDVAALELRVRELARSWIDEVVGLLVARHGETVGMRLSRQIADMMPRSYQDATPVAMAVGDIERIDTMFSEGRDLDVDFVVDPRPGATLPRLRVALSGRPLELSAFIPIVESLGLTVVEEVPFRIRELDVTVHDIGVRDEQGTVGGVVAANERMAYAVHAAWKRQIELDGLNTLILRAGLTWRDVMILRAYRRYRRQAGTTYTPGYINDTVAEHPEVARALVDYFHAKFDPINGVGTRPDRDDALAPFRQACLDACEAVARLDQDRILRAFVFLIDATLRTNAYRKDAVATQADGTSLPYLSLKIDSHRVPDLPQPVPYREISVYSAAVEGVHLRGGPVARGGLRWSDRRDDFRTEVLGLMKAQMSKNSVIVPTGAKGGFVLQRPPSDPQELRSEVERQYVLFVRGLLDVTDNYVGDGVVVPPDVVRWDDDDPYLVVAADKGTATFSDTANGIAIDYGFWLGDAFASGGSKGYDHKKLGITARGGWVAVQQHFRELGIDIQTEPVTVAGVGDMSGDVFGNGMLLSSAIKLVAAFDHRDIFLDPDPDPAASFGERQRLFGVPRSSWQDYDATKLSDGGGIFSRSQKSIPLTRQVRDLLRVEDEALSPAELMSAILRAPVDLFWAGGIGTYVKADTESQADVGDRTNDELRINATELRARVVGEGANLSFTHLARIQYARRGGRINMDAVDNVAGVDSSDHEVNVKILLSIPVADGTIDGDERDALLETVTDDVVAHVLQDVRLQAQRLSLEVRRSAASMHAYERFMTDLEQRGILNRDVEFLPPSAEILQRAQAGAGLTRPELAVLLAYGKRSLTARILESELPDDPSLQPVLTTYFPGLLVDRFPDAVARHRLRRELIATIVANDLANRMGITFAFEVARESGLTVAQVVSCYWAAREVVGSEDRFEQVHALAAMLPPERQMDLSLGIHDLLGRLVRAYAAEERRHSIEDMVERDRPLFTALESALPSLGTAAQQRRRSEAVALLEEDLVDPHLAWFVAAGEELSMLPAIAAAAQGRDGLAVANAFLQMDEALGTHRCVRLLEELKVEGRWQREQRDGLLADAVALRTNAVRAALGEAPNETEAVAVAQLLGTRRERLATALALLDELEALRPAPLDGIGVALRAMRRVVSRL